MSRPPASVEVQAALHRPAKNGQPELVAARSYYAAKPPPKKAYEFSRYKDFEVCKALDALFHGKCAYCESPYRAAHVLDVEHYRPKGGIKEHPTHTGYWWLAAEWANLLPSCPACNQRRKHVCYVIGMTACEFELELQRKPSTTMGKGTHFPLASDNWVSGEDDDLSAEDPLLVNPCITIPHMHMEWVFDYDKSLPIWEADSIVPALRPTLDLQSAPDPRGDASITVFGLNRSGLVRDRMERLKELQQSSIAAVDAFLDVAKLVHSSDLQDGTVERARLAKYKAALYSFAGPSKTYSGMASAYLQAFERDLGALRSAAISHNSP